MPPNPKTTIEEALKDLSTHVKRWENGELSNVNLVTLVQRASSQLVGACSCDENVCCIPHGEHVSPHQNCILR